MSATPFCRTNRHGFNLGVLSAILLAEAIERAGPLAPEDLKPAADTPRSPTAFTITPPPSKTPAPIIGFAGLAGAGKDTAAAALALYGYQPRAFAGALKAMLGALLAYQGASIEDRARMLHGDLRATPSIFLDYKTPRHALQTLGTQWGRQSIDPDLWVNAEFCAMANAQGPFVFSDVRFPNEVDAIRKAAGVVIYIDRPGVERGAHESEQLTADQCDFTIRNVYETPALFQNAVRRLLMNRNVI